MEGLTVQDINILIEALSVWEKRDVSSDILGNLMLNLMTDGAPANVKLEAEKAKKEFKRDQEKQEQIRTEQSIILKAKLITLKDRISLENDLK